MFDIIRYAQENNIAIVIDPYTESGLRITIGTAVISDHHETKVYHAFREEVDKDDPVVIQETCDRLLAMIGSRFAQHYANVEGSRKRAEMEKYWRDGKTILGEKEVDN